MLQQRRPGFVIITLVLLGCAPTPPQPADGAEVQPGAADVSILFIGNSHTVGNQLPKLVCEMIRFRHPRKSVVFRTIPVMFLEDAAKNPQCRREIEGGAWKFVVLQGQKVSMSGRYDYSRKEAIDLAQKAKARAAGVIFYPEWGRRGIAGDGDRTAKIYREMAEVAGVEVAPVGRAWDLALAKRPKLALHAGDGNHQSQLGAFLTACVIFGAVTGESPEGLEAFPYAGATMPDRQFLAAQAAQALAEDQKKEK